MDTFDLLEDAEEIETLPAPREEAWESLRLCRSEGAICFRAAAVRGGPLGGSLFVLQGERGERG